MGIVAFRIIRRAASIPALIALFVAPAFAQGSGLVGSRTMNFTLPSQLGGLVGYGERYYGKHHLVVTFFPAAFTPV